MSSKLRCQIVRDAAKKWMVWKIGDAIKTADGDAREYEQVARIVEDDNAFFVEIPIWGTDGIDKWDRQPRPWMTKQGAVNSVLNPKIGAVA